jgi:hypothetical protein
LRGGDVDIVGTWTRSGSWNRFRDGCDPPNADEVPHTNTILSATHEMRDRWRYCVRLPAGRAWWRRLR